MNLWWAFRVVLAGYVAAVLFSALAFLAEGGNPFRSGSMSDYTWVDFQIGYLVVAGILLPLLAVLRPLFRSVVAGGIAFGVLGVVAFIVIGTRASGGITWPLLRGAVYLLPWGIASGWLFLWALRQKSA